MQRACLILASVEPTGVFVIDRNSPQFALIVFAPDALMWLYAWGVPSAKEKMMTKANAKTTYAGLTRDIEKCLEELRKLPRTRRYVARRAMLQRLYADLGLQLRSLVMA
jgi:predicted aminopeptidase